MAINYTNLRDNVAERLIRENGKQATLIQPGAPTGPEWDPQPGPDIETEVMMVETDWRQFHRVETLVQVGDKFGIISTEAGVTPKMELHDIRIDGKRYQFVDIRPLKPGPVTMLWKFQARV